jgi:hypothetical protein
MRSLQEAQEVNAGLYRGDTHVTTLKLLNEIRLNFALEVCIKSYQINFVSYCKI